MSQPQSGTTARGTGLAFAYVTSLFFAWGFATSLIDPLIAAVRRVFDLSYTESFLTTFSWFIAYGVASLPAAAAVSRLGYSRGIIAALLTMVLGCLIVPVATFLDFYPGILLALFVIASGVTLLQVAANPLVAELGTKKTSHFRLVFSQAFNSLGATVGPWLGAHVLLTGGVFAAGAVAINLFMLGLLSQALGLSALQPLTAVALSLPLGVPAAWLAGRWVRRLLDAAGKD